MLSVHNSKKPSLKGEGDRRRRWRGYAYVVMILALLLASCGSQRESAGDYPKVGDLKYESTVPLTYADQFAIYKYEGGYSLIDMKNSDRMLVVPEGKEVPEGVDQDIVVVQQPLSDVYMAATSAMALVDAIDGLDSITFVGSKHWYTENAKEAYKSGKFVYAGKYNAPDYEMLIDGDCQLAIESTMILHNPEVKEKLIELGIKTIVERSSYEDHPLGRTEWVKVYGALLGKEAEAEAAFNEQAEKISALSDIEATDKTCAFFYVNTAGNAVTYKSKGYVPTMIEIAGAGYLPQGVGEGDDSKLSTVNMDMESFFAGAKDADFIIYNCSIASQLNSVEDFLDLSAVMGDFKAAKEGNVWCTTESMFQQTDKMGSIIQEMNKVFTGEADSDELEFIFRLK